MPGLSMWTLGRLPTFRNALVVRGALVALVLRATMATGGDPSLFGVTHVLLLGVATFAVVLDAGRRREDLFLGTLGVARSGIAGWGLVGAVLGDGIFAALISLSQTAPTP